jgi:hypothetical protein
MNGFSLRYAHGNVLVGRGGDSAALYRLAMTAYPYLPTGGKWSLQRRLQRLAHVLGADFSLWRVNRAYPAEQYVDHTAGLLDERHQTPQAWRAFLEGHQERLRQLGSHTPEVYLAVSLAGQRVPLTGCAVASRTQPASAPPRRSALASSQNSPPASSASTSG